MPRKEDRTAASDAAATRPTHHWSATPKPVPNPPEYSRLVPPSCPVSANRLVMCGTGSVALKASAEGNTRSYKAVKTASGRHMGTVALRRVMGYAAPRAVRRRSQVDTGFRTQT